jgi:hypothetical protein
MNKDDTNDKKTSIKMYDLKANEQAMKLVKKLSSHLNEVSEFYAEYHVPNITDEVSKITKNVEVLLRILIGDSKILA